MNRLALCLTTFASAAIAACVGVGWTSGESGLAYVPVEQCPAAGGTVVVRGGLTPAPICVVRTPDANKRCTDSSQCKGRCIVDDDGEEGLRRGARATGACEADNATFGCFAEVRRGRLMGSLCVD